MLLFCGGCGKPQLSESMISGAQSAYTDAIDAWKAKDYSTAVENFDLAIQDQGLDADQFCEALLRRAECHVELGHVDEAAADLETIADRVPQMDQFHLVRCKLYAKQGDSAKAQAEFEEARKINPQVERPAALN